MNQGSILYRSRRGFKRAKRRKRAKRATKRGVREKFTVYRETKKRKRHLMAIEGSQSPLFLL